jgi:carotenoid cleavage dioxygenase-like enzyme
MAVRFPDEPGFQGRFAPVRLEGEIRGVEVTQGEIPASLRGTYYRVGADPAWPARNSSPTPGAPSPSHRHLEQICSKI